MSKTKTPKTQRAYRLPDDLLELIDKRSEELGVPNTSIVIMALRDWFKKKA